MSLKSLFITAKDLFDKNKDIESRLAAVEIKERLLKDHIKVLDEIYAQNNKRVTKLCDDAIEHLEKANALHKDGGNAASELFDAQAELAELRPQALMAKRIEAALRTEGKFAWYGRAVGYLDKAEKEKFRA